MMYNNTGKNVRSHHPSTAADAAVTTPSTATIPYHLLHHHHQVLHPITIPFSHYPSQLPFSASGGGGGADDDDDFPRRDERFPQWSNQETREFIEIRAQFELEFTMAKGDKNLWEMVANGLREKGYRRTPDQCKCKWNNLVSRYKGQETSDVDNIQCPFFDELHAVFTARANTMHSPQLNAETRFTKVSKTLTNASENQSHEEFSQEPEHEDDEIEAEHTVKTRIAPKRKSTREKRQKTAENEKYLTSADKNNSVLDSLHEMTRSFIAQQQRIDTHWRESMEKHAEERETFEDEWRQKMEKLEREKLVMEKAWREREEQRRLREESRAEKRDALLTTLLNKLVGDENP